MFLKVFWKVSIGLMTLLSFAALLLPQFGVVVWELDQRAYLYLWGGHSALGADVAGIAYTLAALMGLVAAFLMGWGYRDLLRGSPRSIALLNWAALFIAIELAFILGIAEEVLSDIRVQGHQADSFASWGGGISEFLLIALLFVPGWVKKAFFKPQPKAAQS